VATELQSRAVSWLQQKEQQMTDRIKELGLEESLLEIKDLSMEAKIKLGEKNIKTRDDLADLASDELREILGEASISERQANDIIMAARAHWFENDAQPATSH